MQSEERNRDSGGKDDQDRGNSKESSAGGSQPRRGRKAKKSGKVDVKAKLERSRQSARECRARKKLRYQYLEDLVTKRERAVLLLKKEMEVNRELCKQIDEGKAPGDALRMMEQEKRKSDRRS